MTAVPVASHLSSDMLPPGQGSGAGATGPARAVRPEPVGGREGHAASTTPADRAARARAVLARAEERTGMARPAVGGAEMLPVLPPLVPLLPEGGLRRGSAVVVSGSTSLVLALLAEASRSGSWAALVGLPEVGLLAAAQTGIVLSRLALVPDPGVEAATVVAAVVDGVDVVVLGRDLALTEVDRRRLTARVRERGTVLLSTAPWPGAQVSLSVTSAGWSGLGTGEGRLRSQSLVVTRSGRGAAGRPARVRLVLPVDGAVRAGATAPAEGVVPAGATAPAEGVVPAGATAPAEGAAPAVGSRTDGAVSAEASGAAAWLQLVG